MKFSFPQAIRHEPFHPVFANLNLGTLPMSFPTIWLYCASVPRPREAALVTQPTSVSVRSTPRSLDLCHLPDSLGRGWLA